MKVMAWVARAVCVCFACEGLALAGLADLGVRGFSEPIISGGAAGGGAPMMLAKRRSRKKKKEEMDFGEKSGGVRIDPNTAKLKELMVLPLVDEPTAQAIIANRPYATAEDLSRVPEVGPSKYRIFKHLIEIKQPENAAPEIAPAAPAASGAAGEKEEMAP